MMLGMSLLRLLSVGVILVAVGAQSQMDPQGEGQRPAMTVVVSSVYPTDSLGETVYQWRRVSPQDEAPGPVYRAPVVVQGGAENPQYPESMRRKGENGWVRVRGVVTESGDFIDVSVVKSSDPEFEQNALKAAHSYRFKPATLDGKPVAALLTTEYTFNITQH
jgi:TonB family protein